MDAREKALAEATQGDALAGIDWALRLAGDWLEDYGDKDYSPDEADTIAANLAAARDLLDDLEAQA